MTFPLLRHRSTLVLLGTLYSLSCLWGIVFAPYHEGDLTFYFAWAEHIVSGRIPYRDFSFEYPPLSLTSMLPPRLLTLGLPDSIRAYAFTLLFVLENTAFVGLMLALYRVNTRFLPESSTAPGFLRLGWLIVLIASPILLLRYDLFPALLTLLAVLAWCRQRPGWTGFWLGLSVLVKLYALVVFPVIGLVYLATRQHRFVLRFAASGVLTMGLVFALTGLVTDGRSFAFLNHHLERGIQIESLLGSFASLTHVLGLLHVKVLHNYASMNVVTPWDSLIPYLKQVFVGGYAVFALLTYYRFRQEFRQTGTVQPTTLVGHVVASLLLFILVNKVLSPQYLIWILPFIGFLPLSQVRLYALLMGLTVLVFPVFYDQLVALEPSAVLLCALRNSLLIVFFVQARQTDRVLKPALQRV